MMNSVLSYEFDISKLDFFSSIVFFWHDYAKKGGLSSSEQYTKALHNKKKSGIFRNQQFRKKIVIVFKLLHFLEIIEARDTSHLLKR